MQRQEKMKILAKQFGDMKKNTDMKAFFPNKNNPFIWHVSFKGPQDSPFQGGIYHCEINLSDYPEDRVRLQLLHENGSYKVNSPLCIIGITTSTGWTPGTTIESVISALSVLMDVPYGRDGLGYIFQTNKDDILRLVPISQKYVCSKCGADHSTLFK
ncbi:Ubiquitin-conjugating_enzyme E2 [Hexamita inflata]|uniref:Ubiquitin-conjugating enzyme E2 n=1 Tax=Hexamita inflata TaxID=28002 RepID=A0AA86NJN3_9EUKA|nr:Ubiquitin-conjugating enzyme E2 [Hexamita inflata]